MISSVPTTRIISVGDVPSRWQKRWFQVVAVCGPVFLMSPLLSNTRGSHGSRYQDVPAVQIDRRNVGVGKAHRLSASHAIEQPLASRLSTDGNELRPG